MLTDRMLNGYCSRCCDSSQTKLNSFHTYQNFLRSTPFQLFLSLRLTAFCEVVAPRHRRADGLCTRYETSTSEVLHTHIQAAVYDCALSFSLSGEKKETPKSRGSLGLIKKERVAMHFRAACRQFISLSFFPSPSGATERVYCAAKFFFLAVRRMQRR